jgi:hypothetical protein
MELVFIYGQAASGKLTVAKQVADRTGLPLFHNHLVVDAVAAVFPFGSEPFVRLREQFWLDVFRAAARDGCSLIFTFAPEGSVAADFPQRAAEVVQAAGGQVRFFALTVSPDEQERRIANVDRGAFGKLRSTDLLRELRDEFAACMAAMPEPLLTIDTETTAPDEAADRIASALQHCRGT